MLPIISCVERGRGKGSEVVRERERGLEVVVHEGEK